ncbi:MAG: hypothetical protein F6K17_27405, partial [Okeania sp. SIO3C4]|nr:hypothetical protein [Okeania sp. SIO3C4]
MKVTSNEVDVLPLARQFTNPDWIPQDWYLNQPPGYRLLFQLIFGTILNLLGFVWGSIVGRIVIYSLVSYGFATMSLSLGMSLHSLLLSLSFWFLYQFRPLAKQLFPIFFPSHNVGLIILAAMIICSIFLLKLWRKPLSPQANFDRYALLAVSFYILIILNNRPFSIAANEFMIPDLEAKAIAYGFVLIGLSKFLNNQYSLCGLFLGVATSFHVLVGGYSFLAFFGYILFENISTLGSWLRQGIRIILFYSLGGIFAFPAVFQKLFGSSSESSINPSEIYVFVRLPHHLNPASWPNNWWLVLLSYLLIFGMVAYISTAKTTQPIVVINARWKLISFAVLSMIPFLLGLAIAPWDKTGSLLQYYPFRLGDTILPLSTYMFMLCALEDTFSGGSAKYFRTFSLVILTIIFCGWFWKFQAGARQVFQFPENYMGISQDKQELYTWIRQHTPDDAVIVSPPGSLFSLSWQTERGTIAKYKF